MACSRIGVAVAIVPLAVIVGLLALAAPKAPTTGIVLGAGGYDVKMAQAPVATGMALKVISALLTNRVIGPALCRVLLNDNGLHEMVELATQVEDAAVYWPLVRLSPEAHAAHRSQALQDQQVAQQQNLGDTYWGVQDFHKHYEGGGSPSDVIGSILDKAEKIQDSNRVFIEILRDTAIKEAEDSTKRWKSGKPLGVFDGVPFAVKDELAVAGTILGSGSPRLPGTAAEKADDTIVARLRQAGAVLIGKTMMHEYGVLPTGFNAHFGGPVNPYNSGHYPCGSSSGSAVAVALGLVPVAIGFDGGGSIRLPAACNGVLGLSPTFTRIPFDTTGGKVMAQVHGGPIASDATSLALAYRLLAEPMPAHHYFSSYGPDGPPAPHLAHFGDITSLEGMRLGVFWPHFEDADAPVYAASRKLLEALQKRGAVVVNITIPNLQGMAMAHATSILAEFAHEHELHWHRGQPVQPDTAVQLALARAITGSEVIAAARLRGWGMKWLQREVFSRVDVVVSPATGSLPPPLSESAKQCGESNTAMIIKLMRYIVLGNFLGNPAVSIPAGYDEPTKLPIGVHLMADHWEEAKLMRLANAVQQMVKRQHPAAFVDVLQR